MPCQGLYHRPSGGRPAVGFIATHYNVDFSEHYLAEYLATRGYGFLGWNTRYRGNEPYVLIDNALIDIGVGVRWLREVAGVETVVLLGNSGGGSLMAAYQSQATEPSVQPAPGLKLNDAVLDLLPADLYVAVNAHPGRPDVLTGWMDPSVVDEADPTSVDPDLDLFAEDAEIWAVDFRETNRHLPGPLRETLAAEGSFVFTGDMLWRHARSLPELDALAEEPFVLFLEPPSLDERIVNQAALFSLMSSPMSRFDDWLAGRPEAYRRFLIPAELKWEVRDKLDQANINERVLFPGLDGLSRWLRRYYTHRNR